MEATSDGKHEDGVNEARVGISSTSPVALGWHLTSWLRDAVKTVLEKAPQRWTGTSVTTLPHMRPPCTGALYWHAHRQPGSEWLGELYLRAYREKL